MASHLFLDFFMARYFSGWCHCVIPRNKSASNDILEVVEDGRMMREAVATKDAPQAIGPYSQAIKAGGFVFVSGQVAFDPPTGKLLPGDVSAQTERVLKNVEAILTAAGTRLESVVRCTVFLKDMNDFAAMNGVYGRFWKSAPPSRTTVEVARLPKDALIEIDVIALG
jgi:2-iminobutanoate/2-iminopropanoate deaminase